jgi:hypothetical protein
MEDSFKVRVDKTFGSLSFSSSAIQTQQPSSSLSSLWCLTDEEIERNQWNQDHKGSPETESQPQPYFSPERLDDKNLNSEIGKDLVDLDDEDEDDEVESSRALKLKPEDCDDEEWDIKKSIGLDRTLDYEVLIVEYCMSLAAALSNFLSMGAYMHCINNPCLKVI